MQDQSEQAKAEAQVLSRVLETIGAKMQAERGLSAEQVGLAMLAAGATILSGTWEGRKVVDALAGMTGALMETHGIQPDGDVVPRGRPN